jgi:DNA-binding PadR family transcriptional regulator
MASQVRITVAVARVLREFLDEVSQPHYGYELMQRTGYASGKLYPILARLQHAGWLTRTTEEIDPTQAARPARYMYQLTEHGTQAARQELAVLTEQLSGTPGARLRLRPAVGGT